MKILIGIYVILAIFIVIATKSTIKLYKEIFSENFNEEEEIE